MRNLIKKALWPVLQKPWNSRDMEFHYGLWNGVSALYSKSGRQLGEENSRPFLLNHHINAHSIICKYDGSRYGRAINMSALRIAMQNFDAALAITANVRNYHRTRMQNNHEIGIWDLYIISRASIALIAYQIRCNTPSQKALQNRKISDALASQYQFISGIFMICRHMMENADPIITTNSPISADKLYEYADKNGIFISYNGMACAGSYIKIIEFLDFCNNDSDDLTNKLDFKTIIDAPENWYQYALATITLDMIIEIERSDLGITGQYIRRGDSIAIYKGLQNYCARLSPNLSQIADNDMDFIEKSLSWQNYILSLLNRPSLKKIPPKHIALRLNP